MYRERSWLSRNSDLVCSLLVTVAIFILMMIVSYGKDVREVAGFLAGAPGALCGEKIAYPDGIGYSIWYPSGDEPTGVCFDFSADDINDLLHLLLELRSREAVEYHRAEA